MLNGSGAFVVAARSTHRVEAVRSEMAEAGGDALRVACDVTSSRQASVITGQACNVDGGEVMS